jgi:hypothetical protein
MREKVSRRGSPRFQDEVDSEGSRSQRSRCPQRALQLILEQKDLQINQVSQSIEERLGESTGQTALLQQIQTGTEVPIGVKNFERPEWLVFPAYKSTMARRKKAESVSSN